MPTSVRRTFIAQLSHADTGFARTGTTSKIRGAAKVVFRILEIVSDDVLPGAYVGVLDVRRARLHRPNRRLNRAKLDRLLEAEAAG